jgi:hypothetical protein
MNKKKKFDAVQMTRKIRNQLSKVYYQNNDQLYVDLENIRKKYLIKEKSETYKKSIFIQRNNHES